MRQVEDAAERQTAHRDILKNAVGEITDVDLAEVAVRLNQAQFAYEASAGVFATLRGLSLLNVLR
jgi:flagellar hook-associated protein 3 FlgL